MKRPAKLGMLALALVTGTVLAQSMLPKLAQEGHLQGRLRPDREQQSLAPGPDREHAGRGREARLAAGLHRCRRLGRQAGRRRQLDDRPGRRPDLPRPARGKAADPADHGAKKAGIPVILLDRNVDQALAKAGEDYVTFIGSDFIEEGQRVAEWLVKANANGKTKIIELEGTTGSSPANDRKKGFDDVIAKQSRASRSSPPSPATSPATRAARSPRRCCRRIPTPTSIYAHNDEMAIGAIAALEAAGKVAGQGRAGRLDRRRQGSRCRRSSTARSLRSSSATRASGPKAFDTPWRYAAGETIPALIINPTGLRRRERRGTARRAPTESQSIAQAAPAGLARRPRRLLRHRCRRPDARIRAMTRLLLLPCSGIDKRFAGIPALRQALARVAARARCMRWSARTAPASRR